MKEIKYVEKESLLAWLENMHVPKNIIEAIEDENRFPTVSVLTINSDDFSKSANKNKILSGDI